MKKRLAFILAALTLLCALCCVLCACNPAKLSKITGTYELSIYSKQANSSAEVQNLIEERGIKAYLVIRDDGKGYFVYEDNDYTLSAREVMLDYTYSSDEPEKVMSITISDKKEWSNNKIGWHNTLRVNYQGRRECYLTYQKLAVGSLSPQSGTTTYTRVSKATDLSYAQKQLATSLTPLENTPKATLHGMYQMYYSDNEANEYAYRFVDIDVITGNATIYSAPKSSIVVGENGKNSVPQESRDVTTYALEISELGGYEYTLSFAGMSFKAVVADTYTSISYEPENAPRQHLLEVGGSPKCLDELIDNAISY